MFIVSALGFEHSTAWKSFRIFWLMYRSAISLPTVCLPTYIALYMQVLSYMYGTLCICTYVCTQLYIEMSTRIIYMMSTRTARIKRKEKQKTKKTWKRKYKQRTKTNTKKSTINNKKIEATPQCVLTQNGPCPVAQMNCIFFFFASSHTHKYGGCGERVLNVSGGGGRAVDNSFNFTFESRAAFAAALA